MPWTLAGEVSSDWIDEAATSPFAKADYVAPDYITDEEWTITADADEIWTLVA